MTKPGPKPPTPDRVARILVDAEELGDKRAAQKHHCSTRSIEYYRATLASDPTIVGLCEQYKRALQADWLRLAKEVRRKVLRNLESTLPDSNARTLAGIFKIVHEGILAEGVLNEPDAEHGPDPEPSVEPPVEGEIDVAAPKGRGLN